MFKRLFADSFLIGLLLGVIPVIIGYYTFIHYHELMENFGALKFRLYPPRLQLIILALSLIIFRYMMVKWDRVRTGKGFFFALFTATFISFFVNRHKIF